MQRLRYGVLGDRALLGLVTAGQIRKQPLQVTVGARLMRACTPILQFLAIHRSMVMGQARQCATRIASLEVRFLSARFEELAWRETSMGTIILRRRLEPSLKVNVYEVKLDEEFLMSSLFTVAETELAHLGLAEVPGTDIDVVVGGLGLGYTAQAVLEDPRVRSLVVVEALDEVIDWHARELLPDTAGLAADPRTRLLSGDFFAMADTDVGLDPATPNRRFHAILVDIDHTPRHVLHPSHAAFYTPERLRRLTRHLHPGGVFALWSDNPPDADFRAALASAFTSEDAHVITFPNPLTRGTSTSTLYIAR